MAVRTVRRKRTRSRISTSTRRRNGVTGYEFLENPALLGVVSNPPPELVAEFRDNPEPIELGRVIQIKYKHAQNGKYYRHTFDKKPSILLLPDGRVEIFHPTLRLWDEFPD